MSNSHHYLDGITWNTIDWQECQKNVRRIQKRIFKASLSNDNNKVRFLQKLLLRSPHARLIAVHQVTTLNKGKNNISTSQDSPKCFFETLSKPRTSEAGRSSAKAASAVPKPKVNQVNPEEKLKMAKSLQLNGKAVPMSIPKPGKIEKRPKLGIPVIRDRAKQVLAKLILEPEWEAKFEPNSYGFRPGRSSHEAVEAIYLQLHFNTDKYVYDADLGPFDRINHNALLDKLNTFPVMEKQIQAWIKAGIFESCFSSARRSKQGLLDSQDSPLVNQVNPKVNLGPASLSPISPLLANIVLHGLEYHLKNVVSSRDFPKPHPDAARGKRAKASALGFVRYADNFIIIHRDKGILEKIINETKTWLKQMGLEVSEKKKPIALASKSFVFLGFNFILVKKNQKYRIKITPSKENVLRIQEKTRTIIKYNKSSSAYELIRILRPILIGWGNYFKFCECKETFKKVDNIIYKQLRAWVFRRAIKQGRQEVKEKYFPSGNVYSFQGKQYASNWILNGTRTVKPMAQHESCFSCAPNQGPNKRSWTQTNHLPKLSWISSQKFVKVQGTKSVYDGDLTYC